VRIDQAEDVLRPPTVHPGIERDDRREAAREAAADGIGGDGREEVAVVDVAPAPGDRVAEEEEAKRAG